jgi:cytochrome c553
MEPKTKWSWLANMERPVAIMLIPCAILVLGTLLGLVPLFALASEGRAHSNYALRCSGCHGMEGGGSPGAGIPDFREYIGAFARDDEGRTYVLQVPGVRSANLSDDETAEVINYVMRTWGGKSLARNYAEFTADEVTARRAHSVQDIVAFRRKIVARLQHQGFTMPAYPWP